MRYREFDPAQAVASHVARYWGLSVGKGVPDGHPHRVLPDGCVNVIAMVRPGCTHLTVQGAYTTPLMVPVAPGDRYWGVRFWPDAGAAVLGFDPATMVDRLHPGVEALGAEAAPLAERLARADDWQAASRCLDAWLRPIVDRAAPADGAVRAAVLAVIAGHGRPPVGEVARIVGLSARQMQRRFRRATGLTLKTYARIRRMRSSLEHLLDDAPRTWGQVAADLGYADQAHLAREFTRLGGLTPGEVVAYVRGIVHTGVRP